MAQTIGIDFSGIVHWPYLDMGAIGVETLDVQPVARAEGRLDARERGLEAGVQRLGRVEHRCVGEAVGHGSAVPISFQLSPRRKPGPTQSPRM